MSRTATATKFDNAECAKLQRESLNCLINNENNKYVCQPFFARYKKCLKERREREIAERRARMHG